MSRIPSLAPLLLLCLALAACPSRPSHQGESSAPTTAVATTDGDSPTADPGKRTPFFSTELRPRDYSSRPAPTTLPTMGWDFSGSDPIVYSMVQLVRLNDAGTDREMGVESRLSFVPQGDTAEVSLELQRTTSQGEVPSHPQTISSAFREDSTHDASTHEMAAMLPMYFPLPLQPIAVGDEFTLAIAFPLSFINRPERLMGTITSQLVRFVDLDGALGAELAVTIVVDDLSQVAEPEIYGDTFVVGQGLLYFDLDQRRFDSADIAMRLHVDFSNSPQAANLPKASQRMLQDHLVRFELLP